MVDSNSPVILIRDLKAIVNIILDHIVHDLQIEAIPIQADQDFYWDMDKKYLYDIQNKTPILDIGRLADDWGFLSKMNSDRQEAIALMLMHVAPLLRYIGDKVGR